MKTFTINPNNTDSLDRIAITLYNIKGIDEKIDKEIDRYNNPKYVDELLCAYSTALKSDDFELYENEYNITLWNLAKRILWDLKHNGKSFDYDLRVLFETE